MGKIADRFAQKRDPLYAVAKELISVGRKAVAEFEDDLEPALLSDALEEKLESHLKLLTRVEFGRLWSLVQQNLETSQDGEDVFEELCSSAAFIAQHQFAEDGHAKNGHIVSIPLAIETELAAWEATVDAEMSQAIAKILKEFELVADDARVTVLPRMLSPGEGQILNYHDIYRMRGLLAAGDLSAAQQLVTQARLASGAGFPRPTPPVTGGQVSFGQLVAYVETVENSAFPLADELAMQLGQAFDDDDLPDADWTGEGISALLEPDEEQSDSNDGLVAAAYSDVRARLNQVGTALMTALSVKMVTLIEPPSDWISGVEACANMERTTAAGLWIARLAAQVTNGDEASLAYAEDWSLDSVGHGLQVKFYANGNTTVPVGTMHWPALLNEDTDDCWDALEDFIERTEVSPL